MTNKKILCILLLAGLKHNTHPIENKSSELISTEIITAPTGNENKETAEESFEEKLNKIEQTKDSHSKQALRFITKANEASEILKEIQHNTHPFNVVTPGEIEELPTINFRTRISTIAACNKLETFSGNFINNSISIIQALLKEKEEIDIEKIKDAKIKKDITESINKLEEACNQFSVLEKQKEIKEKNWVELFFITNIGAHPEMTGLHPEDLLEKINPEEISSTDTKDYKQKLKLLSLCNLDTIITSNIFKEEKIDFSKINKKDIDSFFKILGRFDSIAKEISLYKLYIAQAKISIKDFFKFLNTEKQNDNNEASINISEKDAPINNKIYTEKASQNKSNDIINALTLTLTCSGTVKKQEINKQAEMGQISYEDILYLINKHNLKHKVNVSNLFEYIQLFLINSEGNGITDKSFIQFKTQKQNVPEEFSNIDEMFKFIHKNIFKSKFIFLTKNGFSINQKYYEMMKPKILEYSSITNDLTRLNNPDNNFQSLLKFMQLSMAPESKEKYIINTLYYEYISHILSEDMRNFAGKVIAKGIPNEYAIKENPEVDVFRISEYSLLPLKSSQFTSCCKFEFTPTITGIRGESGFGKSLLAKTICISIGLAKVFGKNPFAKMEISPGLNFNELIIGILKNQGELSGKLSNHETNKLSFDRLMTYIAENKDIKACIFLDEMVAGTGPHSAESMIKHRWSIKELLHQERMSLFMIEHNENTLKQICDQILNLDFNLKGIGPNKNNPIIDEKLLKQEIIKRDDNPEVFDQIIDREIIKTIKSYYSINISKMALMEITPEEYEKMKKRNPDNVYALTYTTNLNSISNSNDSSGNMTYSPNDATIHFAKPIIEFTLNGNQYFAIVEIKPILKNDGFTIETAKVVQIYNSAQLLLLNAAISLEKNDPSKSSGLDKNQTLLKTKNDILKRKVQNLLNERQDKRTTGFYEDSIKNAEAANVFNKNQK